MGCTYSHLKISDRVILSHSFESTVNGDHGYLEPAVKSINIFDNYIGGGTILHMLPLGCFVQDHEIFTKTCQILLTKFYESINSLTDKLTVIIKSTGDSKVEMYFNGVKYQTKMTGVVSEELSSRIFSGLNVHSLIISLDKYFQSIDLDYSQSVKQNINFLLTSILIGNKVVINNKYSILCTSCQEKQIDIVLKPCNHCCVCSECEVKMAQGGNYLCPICNATIETYEYVYICGSE